MADIDKYHQYFNGDSSPEDLEPEVLAFLEKASELQVPESRRTKDDIWNAIDEATDTTEEEKKTIKLWPLLSGLAAAVVLFFIGLNVFKSGDPEVISTPVEIATTIGEFEEVTLPDGSQVSLNANSTLSYGSEWNRTLTLEGEAFFEVTKGSEFTVNTAGGTVEVLGTSFNVFARDKDLVVACKTGKVKVEVAEKSFEQVITPGETIESHKDTIRKTKIEPLMIGKWQTGEFYFEDRPVMEVLDEIQRQYKVTIKTDSLEGKLFSGYFISSDGLDMALSMVCEPLNLSYNIIDGKDVVVTSN
ncbi:MAG: FecR domain-containing protein [Cytophagales bacterium]|nr:FecR domain-containing protein [Cytophagales bacterium]